MNKFILSLALLLLIVFLGYMFLTKLEEPVDEKVVVTRVTNEQLKNIGIETAGQMIIFLGSKLPIPDGESTYQSIINQIEQTDNKVIEDAGDYILVQSYIENEETGDMEPSFKSRYFFKDGVLTRGPVLVDPESIKGTKITGKKIK